MAFFDHDPSELPVVVQLIQVLSPLFGCGGLDAEED
jgi:hypothetical protein